MYACFFSAAEEIKLYFTPDKHDAIKDLHFVLEGLYFQRGESAFRKTPPKSEFLMNPLMGGFLLYQRSDNT